MTNKWNFLLCSHDRVLATRLSEVCSELGVVRSVEAAPQAVSEALEQEPIDLVFFDFRCSGQEGEASFDAAVELARLAAEFSARVGRVAIGQSEDSQSVIRALRAGVHEFIDLSRPDEVKETVERALHYVRQRVQSHEQDSPPKARSVLILGARPGVGATTVGTYVAAALQKKLVGQYVKKGSTPLLSDTSILPLANRVCLVDLGWPTGESNLYLNLVSDFNFIEASQQVHRLDSTLLKTALPQHSSGMNTISLPADPNAVRQASLTDCLALGEVLDHHYGALVVEANGFPNIDFLRKVADRVDDIWLVCDQNMASLIAVADLLLHFEGLSVQLVINRYDARAGLTAKEIAERFSLNLLATLPDRGWEMMKAANLAEPISQGDERDSYNKAIVAMVNSIYHEDESLSAPPSKARLKWLPRWVSHSR